MEIFQQNTWELQSLGENLALSPTQYLLVHNPTLIPTLSERQITWKFSTGWGVGIRKVQINVISSAARMLYLTMFSSLFSPMGTNQKNESTFERQMLKNDTPHCLPGSLPTSCGVCGFVRHSCSSLSPSLSLTHTHTHVPVCTKEIKDD